MPRIRATHAPMMALVRNEPRAEAEAADEGAAEGEEEDDKEEDDADEGGGGAGAGMRICMYCAGAAKTRIAESKRVVDKNGREKCKNKNYSNTAFCSKIEKQNENRKQSTTPMKKCVPLSARAHTTKLVTKVPTATTGR